MSECAEAKIIARDNRKKALNLRYDVMVENTKRQLYLDALIIQRKLCFYFSLFALDFSAHIDNEIRGLFLHNNSLFRAAGAFSTVANASLWKGEFHLHTMGNFNVQ